MKTLSNLKYSKTHEWVEFLEDGHVRIGITDYAQDALGDLVYVNLPIEGDTFDAGEVFGDLESVKAVSDLYTPVAGTVAAVNEDLLDAPEMMNQDPYGAWIIELSDIGETEELLDDAAYEALCAEEA